MMERLFLFFHEPEPDRWIWGDRYPRRVVRRLLRRQRISGARVVFKNLCLGFQKTKTNFIANSLSVFAKEPYKPVGFIGKLQYLEQMRFGNPLVIGPAVLDHPLQDSEVLQREDLRALIVPCDWYRRMFKEHCNLDIHVWPVGIDTEQWCRTPQRKKKIDIIIYDKVTFRRFNLNVVQKVRDFLDEKKYSYRILSYGEYLETHLRESVKNCKAAIVLSHTETQGIAYQQIMSSGLPILAWDPGVWDTNILRKSRPSLPPDIVYENTSVPYFDERCGCTFSNINQFEEVFELFWENVLQEKYKPREYILENLTLEKSATQYLEILKQYW